MLKRLVSIFITSTTLLANAGIIQAQQPERFIYIGNNSSGYKTYVDLQSISGNNFDIYQGFGYGIAKTGLMVNCTYKQIYQTRATLYDENHNVVDDKSNTELLEPSEGSVVANALKYMCSRRQ